MFYLGLISIHVHDCRCTVVRWYWADGALTYAPAENWEGLEADAERAVIDQGGAITVSGIYDCPDVLAARAQFAEEAR